MKTRIIGLGNTIMTDDAVGIHVARQALERIREQGAEVDVVESSVAGLALLELMRGWEKVILIDAVQLKDLKPGDIVRLDPKERPVSLRLCSVHEADLPTVLALADQLGYAMPREIVIFGVQGADLSTFGEELSAEVASAVPRGVAAVLAAAGMG